MSIVARYVICSRCSKIMILWWDCEYDCGNWIFHRPYKTIRTTPDFLNRFSKYMIPPLMFIRNKSNIELYKALDKYFEEIRRKMK